MSDFFGIHTSEGGYGGEESPDDSPEGDSNEYLEIDDELSVVERIKKYAKSDLVLHRLYIVRELSDAVRTVEFEEARDRLVPAMEDMLRDMEPVVRQALVEQIPEVSRHFASTDGEGGYTLVLHILLPMVAELTTDRNAQVRAAAVESLEIMARVVRHTDLEPYVLPIIKSLSNDNTEEEHRVEAAMLLHNLAPILGPELCMQVVLSFVVKLAEDPVFRVRKTVAANLGNICRTVGVETTTQHLLPIFVTLASDDIWGVRKGCAESLVAVAEAVSPIERYSNLIEVFEKLAEDPSRWVRSAAYQNLGPFIATFEGHQVTPKLLRYYTGMVSDTNNSKYGDSDTMAYCAYSFPAVLQVVGAARWSELSDTYQTLVNDLQWKVRRSLSHSIHEVARILGPQLAETALLSPFDLFLRDLDEVRIGVIRNIAAFLAAVPPHVRERYLPVLTDMAGDTANWRFRKLLAKQLGALGTLFPPEATMKVVFPLAVALLKDTVATVRRAAAKGFPPMAQRFCEDQGNEYSDKVLSQLIAFATDSTYSMRQLYAQLSGALSVHLPSNLFDPFLPPLLALVADPIPNVRIAVATAIAGYLAPSPHFSAMSDVTAALQKLKQDNDRDVAYAASNPPPQPIPTNTTNTSPISSNSSNFNNADNNNTINNSNNNDNDNDNDNSAQNS